MIIIGERLNTSRKAVEDAVEARDEETLKRIAIGQVEKGAQYLDINCGTRISSEVDDLAWLARLVQSAVEVPLTIDSPNAEATEAALKVHKGKAIVNSISAEKDRYELFLPLIKENKCGVVALCMDESGIPETAENKFRVAEKLVKMLNADGIGNEDIYLDPLVQPLSSNQDFPRQTLEAIRLIMTSFPGIHTTCGLSNVSHGLPKRRIINETFLTMCVASGLDAPILDPNDAILMQNLMVAETLMGKDEFCLNYIGAFRAGKLL